MCCTIALLLRAHAFRLGKRRSKNSATQINAWQGRKNQSQAGAHAADRSSAEWTPILGKKSKTERRSAKQRHTTQPRNARAQERKTAHSSTRTRKTWQQWGQSARRWATRTRARHATAERDGAEKEREMPPSDCAGGPIRAALINAEPFATYQ